MASRPVKRGVYDAVSLKKEPLAKKLREEALAINYKCIICRGQGVNKLYNIQAASRDKLFVAMTAMTARQDKIFTRLYCEVKVDTWSTENCPKWHEKYRNWYLNAEKKRLGTST